MQMGMGHAIITKQRVMNGISFADVAACAAFEAEEGFVFVQILPGRAAKDRPADGVGRLVRAPAGTFTWKSGWPWTLRQQWKAGSANILNGTTTGDTLSDANCGPR